MSVGISEAFDAGQMECVEFWELVIDGPLTWQCPVVPPGTRPYEAMMSVW
jgi:hypothetical protein